MTKEQIWDLIEIHQLLAETSTAKNIQGFDLLTAFIEDNAFTVEEDK
jgi:hypothetical protein